MRLECQLKDIGCPCLSPALFLTHLFDFRKQKESKARTSHALNLKMLFAGQFHSSKIWFNIAATKNSPILNKKAGASYILGGGAPLYG